MSEYFDDLEFETLIKEIDEASKEINIGNSIINEGFEWLDTLSGIAEDVDEFIQNMESLLLAFKTITDNKKKYQFFNWNNMVGYIKRPGRIYT